MRLPELRAAAAVAAMTGTCLACAPAVQATKLLASDTRELRPAHEADADPDRADLLVIALDGVDRKLLYGMLERGEMPETSALLGGRVNGAPDAHPHAYFDHAITATLPSITAAAWATVFTGTPPAQHGVPGNEYFVRERRQLAAPIPNSVSAVATALSVFTEGYANGLLAVPTIYERMRAREPDITMWVSMSQYYKGADMLLLTRRAVLGDAFNALLSSVVDAKMAKKVWGDLDKEDVEVVVEKLEKGPLPNVLTLYVFGTDDYAHVAPEGPDESRRAYLRDVVDPALGKLRGALSKRGALASRYVVITGDHGHTQVLPDDAHSMAMNDEDDPPAVVRGAGFRLRPFKLEVDAKDDFQAVLAYEGAMAFAYVADRSTCAAKGTPCDWSLPPRYREDVLALAEGFRENDRDGRWAPSMKGALDMIFVRRPRPFAEVDLPFEVYVGDGKTVPVDEYLAKHPHPTYVDVASRLRDLAVGPHGERAGDVLLLAHNGDRERPEERFYFAPHYQSWHGSPSRNDSDIPLVVGNPGRAQADIARDVKAVLGQEPHQQAVGELIVRLRGEKKAAR